MALLCTHAKFAFDLLERLDVNDEQAFCSGAVYPDSRYATGIRRRLTHGPDAPHDPFAPDLTDFERGWAAHNLYDDRAGQRYLEHAPYDQDDIRQFNDAWSYVTAEKLVEDLESYRSFGPRIDVLRHVAPSDTPVGEDFDLLEDFYASVRGAYTVGPDYSLFLRTWGAEDAVVAQVMAFAESIGRDDSVREGVLSIYKKVTDDVLGS